MIRPFTLLALIAAGGAGLNLYNVKREAQLEEQSTVKILREAKDVRTHAGLLHAEYDLLSDPDRLHELANQVLKLQPTDPKQYVALADLTKRLPATAPLPAPPEPPKVEAPKPEAPLPDLVAEKAEPKLPERSAERSPERSFDKSGEKLADKPEPKPLAEKPVQLAIAPKPASVAAAPAAPQAAQPAPAASHPVVAAKPAPTIVADARPVPAQAPRPQAPRPMPAVVEAPAPVAMPYAGSALGMARMRAKFVPADSGAER